NTAFPRSTSITIHYFVPAESLRADTYSFIAYDQQTGAQIGSAIRNSEGSGVETNTFFPIRSTPNLIMVTLNTHVAGEIVFTDTLRGVSGQRLGFLVVDDHVQLVQGSAESSTVDVLANDRQLSNSQRLADVSPLARLDNATNTIVNDGGLDVSVNGLQQVVVSAKSALPGQYRVVIETSLAGQTPQRQFLYVEYLDPETVPPTVNNDSYIGFAGEEVRMPVLDNDSSNTGGNLTIASFTQPGGATVTQRGDILVLTGQSTGTYSFSYTAQDGFGNQASAQVIVRLIRRNDPPPAPPAPPIPM
ncbi:MAG: Ig-like domain-containing protein, partial [Nitrospinota bacterium]|nr:Ig-like domain-containing protein [Nitrospinota bacterium]